MVKVLKEEELTNDQLLASKKIEKFMNSNKNYFLLKGCAGTGKTTLLSYIKKKYKEEDYRFITIAPTHKAVSVLRDNGIRKSKTFHSFFCYTMEYNDNGSESFKPNYDCWQNHLINQEELNNNEYDICKRRILQYNNKNIIIIDECSMIKKREYSTILEYEKRIKELYKNEELINYLDELDRFDIKFIFVGDSCQLPPVEKDKEGNTLTNTESHVFTKIKNNIMMMINKRAEKEDIISIYNLFRDIVLNYNKNIDKLKNRLRIIKSNHIKNVKICYNKKNFVEKIYNQFKRDKRDKKNKQESYVLVCSNKSVSNYNNLIKENIYKNNEIKSEFHIDQIVVFTRFIKIYCNKCNKDKIFYSSDTLQILNVELIKKDIINDKENYCKIFSNKNKYYNIFKYTTSHECYKCETNLIINRVHEDDRIRFNNNFNNERKEITNNIIKLNIGDDEKIQKMWDNFYKNKYSLDVPITDSFCSTIYKSQGSTYNNVFIDMENIVNCRKDNIFCLTRELYTSVSRGKNKIILLINYNWIKNTKDELIIGQCNNCDIYEDIKELNNYKCKKCL